MTPFLERALQVPAFQPSWESVLIWLAPLIAAMGFSWLAPRSASKICAYAESTWFRLGERRGRAMVLIGAAALACGLAQVALVGFPVPRIHDEFSYLLAADTFASGRVANPPHPMWVYFETVHVNQQPTYGSIYPPAQGLLLALGKKLGHPCIGVLLSGVFMCIAVYWMLEPWFPPRWALVGGFWAVALIAFTYWLGSYWGGAPAAIGGALTVGAYGRLRRSLRSRSAVALATGIGILINSRPFEGLVLAATVVAALTWRWRSEPAACLLTLALPGMLVLSVVGALMLYYFWRTTGSPVRMPYRVYLQDYSGQRMFVWQKQGPELAYRHESLREVYRRLQRSEMSYLEKLRANAKRALWMYFRRLWWLPLLFLPWVVRLPKYGPLLLFGGTVGMTLVLLQWFHSHYAAPIMGVLIAFTVLGLRLLRLWRRPTGRLIVLVLMGLALVDMAETAARAFVEGQERHWADERLRIERDLSSAGGRHLVIVLYLPGHHPFEEWVYNGADIDRASVVWAREMKDMDPLLYYFSGHTVWSLTVGAREHQLQPYRRIQTSRVH